MPMDYVAQQVFCVIPTQPGHLNWTAYTMGYTQTRMFLPDVGIFTTPQVPGSKYSVTQHEVSGLPIGQEFSWVLQGTTDGTTWVDLAQGTHRTNPSAAGTALHRIGAFACGKTNDASNSGLGYAWAHAKTRGLTLAAHLGDWHYRENTSVDETQHFLNLLKQCYEFVPDMGSFLQTCPFYYFPSDHEFGNNINTGGADWLLSFQDMWRHVWSQYASPLATEGALCWSTTIGNDIELVFADFRNYERTNSDDPNVPFDSPERAAFGPEQLAWLIGKINERHRFTILFMDPVWLSRIDADGNEVELTNKTDAMASYAYQRAQIAAAMAGNPNGVLVTGDYHLAIYCSAANNPHGHWTIVGAAGVDAGMTYRGGAYDAVYPPLDTLDQNPPLSQWLELDVNDTVDAISLTTYAWDCLTDPANPVSRITTETLFDLTGGGSGGPPNGGIPVAVVGSAPGSLMTPQPGELQYGRMLTGGRSTARWRQLTGWRDLPPADLGDSPQPATHGDIPGDVLAQGLTVTYDMFLDGSLAVGSKAAALKAIELCAPLDSTERALVVDDGAGPWLRWARTIARSVTQDKTFQVGPIPVSLQWRCADPRRYALDQRSGKIGVQPPSGGLAYPLDYGVGLDYGIFGSQSVTVTNDGTVPTPPVILIRGAITHPILRCNDWQMAFDIDLGPAETLVIDTAAGTVMLGSADRLFTLTDDSTPPQACLLKPGATTITLAYQGVPAAGNASATIQWRDATM